MSYARAGRDTAKAIKAANRAPAPEIEDGQPQMIDQLAAIAPPPGKEDVNYASLAGN